MLKKITLTAEESIIKKAREKAKREHTTLNLKFRKWLQSYIMPDENKTGYYDLMNKLDYVNPDRKFSRDELNDR